MASDPLVIGIDFGTGSSKGVLVRADTGRVLATATRDHKTSKPRPGYHEHDADGVWWNDFKEITGELVGTASGAGEIVGLCTSGIGPCQLPADADGKPLRPAILYGVDTRSHAEVEELTEKYGEDNVVETFGNRITSQSQGAKWLWLVRNEPKIYEQTEYFFMSHTYVAHRLTGEYVLDHVSASMCEPMYSPYTRDWMPDYCEDVAPGLNLPDLRYCNEVAGHVTKEAARETGLPEGIPVAVGTTDAWAEALSVGVKKPGEAMLMYGSTMVAVLYSDEVVPHPNLWSNTGMFDGTYSIAGGLSASGALTDWMRGITSSEFAILTDEASDSPPGSNGLLALPYFAGERTPISDPMARGVIAGLSLSTTRGDMYRSMLEASTYGMRHLMESTAEAGAETTRYVAVGGGTKGDLWPQIVSDVIGIEQEMPKMAIGAAYGDALLAAQVSGHADADTDWTKITKTVHPDPDTKDRYDQLFADYLDLYPATKDIVHNLAALQLEG